MLRDKSNPIIIREAINTLTICRELLDKNGFSRKDDWRLKKLYGLDHDDKAPLGVFRTFQRYTTLATESSSAKEDPKLQRRLKEEMINIFNEEIESHTNIEQAAWALTFGEMEFQSVAALVTDGSAIENIIRGEAHLSREFDRALNQLDRLQRMRLGQAALPAVRVELSR